MFQGILLRAWRQLDNGVLWTYSWVVIALIVVSLVYAIVLQFRENRAPLLRILYCAIATLCLALFCGLRHQSVGTDTERYYFMIGQEFNVTFNQILDNYLPNRAENREVEELPRDVVFYTFSDQLRLCGLTEYGIFCFYALFYVGVAGWLIYKYSDSPIVSYFAFIALGTYIFNFTGLRQSIAIGWVMLAYPFIQKRNFLFFTFFVLVGMLFHKSAVVFFPAYFFGRIEVRVSRLLILAAVVVFIFYKARFVGDFIVKTFGDLDERVESYFGEQREWERSAMNCTIRFTIYFLYLFVCMATRGRRGTKHIFTEEETILMNLLLIGTIFEMFSLQGWGGMTRLGLYYRAFSFLLVPKLIDETKRYIPIPYTFTVAAFAVLASLYFMKVISIYGPYHFNWEGWIGVV
ncbi:MAG: EpsG family protein [Thermoguttaceae bacterium]|nr:EpsG family protein [Thermoguttaceae bacterium]